MTRRKKIDIYKRSRHSINYTYLCSGYTTAKNFNSYIAELEHNRIFNPPVLCSDDIAFVLYKNGSIRKLSSNSFLNDVYEFKLNWSKS